MKNKVFSEFNVCILVIQIVMLYALFIAGFYSYSYWIYKDDTVQYHEVEEKIEESSVLIVSKKTDQNIGYVVDNKSDFCKDNFNDVILDQEMKQMKDIKGIQSIQKYYNIPISSSHLKVYDHNEFVKEIKNEYKRDDMKVKGEIYLVGYYDFQNIQHKGKRIKGVYLSHRFKEIVDEEIIGKTINIDCHIPSAMELIDNYEVYQEDEKINVKGYDIKNIEDQLSFTIDGILDAKGYSDTKNDEDLIIYVPVSQIEQILIKYKDATMPYQTRQYIIQCQSNQKENITKALLKMNDLYVVENEYVNIYINDTKSLKNMLGGYVIIVLSLIMNFVLLKRQKNKKKLYMKEYKNIYNKLDILSVNIVMLLIFVATVNYYYVIFWLIPALLLLYIQYIAYKHFLYKDCKH